MKAIFINCILATTTFLSFDIRTTVGPPEVYLQKSEISNLPAFEAEGSEAFEICHFYREMPQRIRFRCLRKREEAEKLYQKHAP